MAFNKDTGMYEGYIYLITNKINNKKYVGQTITTLKQRFSQHVTHSKHSNQAICRAIVKYGKDNFSIEEIKMVDDLSKKHLIEKLNVLEKKYIKEYNSLVSQYGYNIDIGGASCSYFSKPVNVYDLDANIMQKFDSANEAARFYEIDVNTVTNICNGVQNRCMNHDVIFRYQGDSFDKYDSTLLIPNAKVIYQFTMDGNFIGEYGSAYDAVRTLNLNIHPSCLSRAARKNKTAYGYVWSYEKEFKFDINNYRNYVSVDKYSLDGEFLENYKSVTDAGKSLNFNNVKTSWITDVCSGKWVTAYGYIWRYKGEPFNKYRTKHKVTKMVNQYSKEDIFIKTYYSIVEAAKSVGLKTSGDIGKTCKTGKWMPGGYKWFFANDPNQPDKSKIIA